LPKAPAVTRFGFHAWQLCLDSSPRSTVVYGNRPYTFKQGGNTR
jgi:hypothetical protein